VCVCMHWCTCGLVFGGGGRGQKHGRAARLGPPQHWQQQQTQPTQCTPSIHPSIQPRVWHGTHHSGTSGLSSVLQTPGVQKRYSSLCESPTGQSTARHSMMRGLPGGLGGWVVVGLGYVGLGDCGVDDRGFQRPTNYESLSSTSTPMCPRTVEDGLQLVAGTKLLTHTHTPIHKQTPFPPPHTHR
jgi:hypothetical protein